VLLAGFFWRIQMSKALQIIQAKPNPFGKDKTSSGQSKPEQLLGEWVDVKNFGTEPIQFSTMTLSHTLFDDKCQTANQTEKYWTGGTEQLLPGQVIRIHTGKLSDRHLMAEVDKVGVDWHGYANRSNFVLNNRCGDRLFIAWPGTNGKTTTDATYYRPNPPEGGILRRRGDVLEPVSAVGR
jgi:hypothetical protein